MLFNKKKKKKDLFCELLNISSFYNITTQISIQYGFMGKTFIKLYWTCFRDGIYINDYVLYQTKKEIEDIDEEEAEIIIKLFKQNIEENLNDKK